MKQEKVGELLDRFFEFTYFVFGIAVLFLYIKGLWWLFSIVPRTTILIVLGVIILILAVREFLRKRSSEK